LKYEEQKPEASENDNTSIAFNEEIKHARFVIGGAYNLLIAMKNVMEKV
jgi:hypothetical protein